jgi:hypothetical protein
MPVNSRMTPPRNARLSSCRSGTSAPAEYGICEGLPCSRYTAPRTTTSTAGRIDPATVPTAPTTDDARTPPRATAVVPQKNASMTTTR